MNNNFIGYFIRKLAREIKEVHNCTVKTQWVNKREDASGGNSKADKLATEAAKLARMPDTDHAYNFLALSSTKTKIKGQAWNQWDQELATGTTYPDRAQLNENVKLFIPNNKPIRSVKFPKLCNYFTTQFITTYGNLAFYKERLKSPKTDTKNAYNVLISKTPPNMPYSIALKTGICRIYWANGTLQIKTISKK